jgi:hypothetical protein
MGRAERSEDTVTSAKKGTKKSKAEAKTAKGDALPSLVDLTPEEVTALPKPRVGFEEHVEGLLSVLTKFPSEMASAKVDPDVVRQTVAGVVKLDAAIAPARKQLELLEETRLLLASNAWRDLLEVYRIAQAVSAREPKIAKAIEPFSRLLAVGPKKKDEKKGE